MSFAATAGAGLAAGWTVSQDQTSDATAPAGWSGEQIDDLSVGTLNSLVVGEAKSALAAEARRVLHGREARSAAVPFAAYTLRLRPNWTPAAADLVSGKFRSPVLVHYELSVDHAMAARTVDATFVLSRQGWQLNRLGRDGSDLWEHESVDAARSGRSLVIGATVYSSRLPSLAAQVEQARADVAGFWSAKWPANVVVLLPSKPSLMNPLVGSDSASQLPAAATFDRGKKRPVIRITLNPDVFFGLPYIAQQIVLRHEITHVAQDALGSRYAPTWLTEGLAEYVGYRGTGIATSIVAGDALSAAAANGPPASFPRESTFNFDRAEADRRLGYEEGWALCRMVADRYGESQLVPLYRAAATGDAPTRSRIDDATRRVLGISEAELIREWQSWLVDNS